MTPILDGLRVLGLGVGPASTTAATLLADLGADVIAVGRDDPRTGPGPVSADWLVGHRGQRLGLATDAAEAADLLEHCHVVITDDADTPLRPTGEQVVLVMAPYAEHAAAPWAGGAEAPELLAALSGLAANQSSYSGDPVDGVYPYLRTAHAAWAATCALAALVERERSGRGQRVVVSGLHVAGVFCGFLYGRPETEPDHSRASGPGGTNPMYTRYQGSDGRWFFVGGLGPKFGRAVLELTGSAHLLADPRVDGALHRVWAAENSAWVTAHLREVFGGESAEHWVKLMEAADVPCTLLHPREEWFGGAQVAATGQHQTLADPLLGPVVTAGAPIFVDGVAAPARATPVAVPVAELDWLGPDTWVPRGGGAAVPNGAGPLHGLRIATLGSFVAGPYAGALLADLGADLVKVEPPQGDPWRLQGWAYNRGARGFAVDLRTASGREAAHAVLGCCDLVLDNFRLGVSDRIGVGHAELNASGTGPATVSVTAYGDTGPLAARPGYDTVAQAASGIMTAMGGDAEPVMSSLPSVDHTTATLGAYAAVLGLLHRIRTGASVHVSTSLAAAALYLQTPDLTEFRGRGPGRSGGRDFPGPDALDRIYPVVDGFVRLQAAGLDAAAWRAVGLPLDAARAAADPAAAITAALAGSSREVACAALGRAGVPAVPVRSTAEIVRDPELRAAGLLEAVVSGRGERFGAAGRFAAFSRTQQADVRPAPGLGEHTRELLAEAGRSAAQVTRWEEAGAVVAGGPLDLVYLPPYR